MTADAIGKAMGNHIDFDSKQLLLCEVQVGDVVQGDLEETEEVEQQCHEPDNTAEEAWGDVNNVDLTRPKFVKQCVPRWNPFAK